jgi:PDZ domain
MYRINSTITGANGCLCITRCELFQNNCLEFSVAFACPRECRLRWAVPQLYLVTRLTYSIIQVNGVSVVNATHEHAVKLIKNAGDTLTLTVVEGRSLQSATNQKVEQLDVDNALSARITSAGSSFKPGECQPLRIRFMSLMFAKVSINLLNNPAQWLGNSFMLQTCDINAAWYWDSCSRSR